MTSPTNANDHLHLHRLVVRKIAGADRRASVTTTVTEDLVHGLSDDARAAGSETGSALLRLMVSEIASALRDFHRSLHGAAPEGLPA